MTKVVTNRVRFNIFPDSISAFRVKSHYWEAFGLLVTDIRVYTKNRHKWNNLVSCKVVGYRVSPRTNEVALRSDWECGEVARRMYKYMDIRAELSQ